MVNGTEKTNIINRGTVLLQRAQFAVKLELTPLSASLVLCVYVCVCVWGGGVNKDFKVCKQTTSEESTFPQLSIPSPAVSYRLCNKYVGTVYTKVGRDSVVSIATRHELDGPGIESQWRRDFPCPSSPLNNGYPIFPGGKAAGAWR